MSEPQDVRVPDIGDFTDVPVIEIHVSAGDEIDQHPERPGVHLALGGEDAEGVFLHRVEAAVWGAARGAGRRLRHPFMLPSVPGCAGTVAC